MPFYFIDTFDDGIEDRDTEGLTLDGYGEARAHAVEALLDLCRVIRPALKDETMPKQQTRADDVVEDARAPHDAQCPKPDKSEAFSPKTSVQKEKEAADRTHMTVTGKPDPSPHEIRKPSRADGKSAK